LIFFPPS